MYNVLTSLIVENRTLDEIHIGHFVKDNNFSLADLEENIVWKGMCIYSVHVQVHVHTCTCICIIIHHNMYMYIHIHVH